MEKTIKAHSLSRIDWIDIAKGIGIFLMVMGHTSIPKLGGHWIYSFHMPLFFFLSGFLFQPGKYTWSQFIKRKVRTMVVPYFFFVVLNWIVCELLQYDSYPPHSLLNVLADGSNGAIWFIYVLFFTELFFFGIESLKNLLQSKWMVLISCMIATMIGWFFFLNSIHFSYKLEVVGMSLFFYIIGYITRMKGWYLKRYNLILLFFLAVVQFILANFQNRCLDMASNSYGTGLPSLLIALLGIGVTIECSKYIVKSPFWISNSIMYIGKNTIVVVGMSQMTLMGMKKYFELYEVPGYISSPVRHFLLWCLMALFIYLFNKYIPFLIGKNSK